MRILSPVRTLLSYVFNRRRVEQEMEEEFRSHLAMRLAELERQGIGRPEAERRAQIEFGGFQNYKEECREALGTRLFQELWQDFRYGLRQLRRNPGFTAVAVLTLALGIGATTSIFSVAEAVLWKPLPFPNSQQLVTIEEHNLKRVESHNVSPPDYLDWRDQNTVFEQLAALKWPEWDNLSGGKMAERVRVSAISSNYFKVLGIQPQLGRPFFPRENREGRNRVAILSHRIWVRQFGANPDALGKTIKLDGEPYVVVGVNPPGLRLTYMYNIGVFIPLVFRTGREARRDWALGVLGRLKKGVSLAQAQSDMDAVARRLEAQYPKTNAGRGVIVRLWRTEIGRYYRPKLLLFLCAAFFVLLIACVNVANLLLARSTGRRTEFAVRAALGSGRKRLTRQLLTESCLLALIGSSVGILLAVWGVDIIVNLGFQAPRIDEVGLDGRVLVFALAITSLTAVLFGLAPASAASRIEINSSLKGARSESTSFGHARMRKALVIAELAMAMVLLTGAGLFINSLLRVERAPLGFNPHHLVFSYLSLKGPRYTDDRRVESVYQQLVEKTNAIPGVQSAVATSHFPLTGGQSSYFEPNASPNPAGGEHPWALTSVVTPGYLRAMQIPLLRGRDFTEHDDAASPRVAIISKRLAQRYFPGENPLGKQITILSGLEPGEIKSKQDLIVGVAANIKEVGVNEVPFVTIYLPFAQNPMRKMFVVARAPTGTQSILAALRREISSVDKDLPVYDVKTMEQFISENRRGDRLNTILIQTFAILALILAAVGIYGVISYSVGQRTREIGIRLALGARPGNVLSLVIRQSAVLVAYGLAVGLVASVALGRLLHNVLYLVPFKSNGLIYGVNTHDPVTLSSAAIILAAVAILASYIPARRAAKVDPIVALRYE